MNYESRQKLYSRLQQICNSDSISLTKAAKHIEECWKRFSIPQSVISDYIYGKESVEYIAEELLPPLASVLLPPEELKEYYEEKDYAGYKYSPKELPAEFSPVIQVAEDQWIGTIDIADLIALYDAGKIRYNEETQRPMKRVRHGSTEVYHFFKNDKAINEMVKALEQDRFVPNTITINLIRDGFEGELVADNAIDIREIDHFDLLDGYHRFLALRKMRLLNLGFQFRMELRITNFTKEKAWQFIFQEDQKTKMTKMQSASYNTMDMGSQIVAFLKQKLEFGDCISRNGGIIDEPQLVRAINDIYITKVPRTKSGQMGLKREISAELQRKLTALVDEDPKLLDRKWENDYIAMAVWCCRHYSGDSLGDCINNFYASRGDSRIFYSNKMRGIVVNTKELNRLWEARCRDYV